jgi:hypothetical protein
MVQSLPTEHQVESTNWPWDDKDLPDKLDVATNSNLADNNNGSGAPNNQAGIYSESVNNAALRFGICFTTKQFYWKFSVMTNSHIISAKRWLSGDTLLLKMTDSTPALYLWK